MCVFSQHILIQVLLSSPAKIYVSDASCLLIYYMPLFFSLELGLKQVYVTEDESAAESSQISGTNLP